jgi:hypothetical protein
MRFVRNVPRIITLRIDRTFKVQVHYVRSYDTRNSYESDDIALSNRSPQ